MEPNRWKPIISLLREFQSLLAKDLPGINLIAATDRNWSEYEYNNRKPEGFPTRLKGVYLLFNSVEKLQYIGVTTRNYNYRVWEWDEDPEFDRRFIDIIPFDDKFISIGLSLEHFLIARLRPSYNKR